MKHSLFVFLLTTVACTPGVAGNFSFSGTFSTDDQIRLLNFSISNSGPVTIQSWGYGGTAGAAGGVNAAGNVIGTGGFDSLFTLYTGNGGQIGLADEGASCGLATNAFGNGCEDAFMFQPSLDAGNYILALTVSGNGPVGDIGDGFTRQGDGNFTCGNGSPFCDVFNQQLNGNWAVDILTVDSADVSGVPEPSALGLFVMGGLGLLKVRCLKGNREVHVSEQK